MSKTRHWRELLLEQPLDPELVASLPDFLKSAAHDFLAGVPAQIPGTLRDELDLWYGSSAGQGALVEFAEALWMQMAHFADGAMPGHDARHAMYKVPAASLEYVMSEQVEGWERVGVLGALLHDHGRWAEERIFGWPGASVVHARLSYLLGRELLDRTEMPLTIKQHILSAAIRHTSGAVPADPMPLKLTVSADRDQLYGPEIILRIAHHAIGRHGGGSSFYGEKPGRSVLTQLERYLTHRLPGPLFSRHLHVQRLWNVLSTFLMIAEDEDSSRARFVRILTGPGPADAIQEFDWATKFEEANIHRGSCDDPEDALATLLNAAHTAPSPTYRRAALDKVSAVSPANRARLGSALYYANNERIELDTEQFVALERIAGASSDDRLIGTVSKLLLDTWHGTC